jgi:hypothetical protein
MPTLKQFLANRLNAQKSTGPQTAQGKMRASVNAVRHGLRASKFVTILESAEEFDELRERLFKDWKPRGITQEMEVDRLAQTYWQLERAQRALAEALNTEICGAIGTEAARQLTSTIQRIEKLGRPGRGELDAKEGRKCQKAQRHYENIVYLQDEVKMTVRDNSLGVGAAICCLGDKRDKLSTLLRYRTHWEREAQRVVQNLIRLKAQDDW